MNTTKFKIRESKSIPYSDYNKSVKHIAKKGGIDNSTNSFLYALKRFKNYLILLVAYIAPSNSLRVRLNKWKGVNIGENVYIGMFVFLDNAYPEYINIEDKVSINAGSMIVTHFNPYKHFEKIFRASVNPVVIKEGAVVAIRCVVLPDVTIGAYSMVTAGSVVTKNVEPYTIVRGNPAVKVADYKKRMTNNDVKLKL